jgi:hypothetical protein
MSKTGMKDASQQRVWEQEHAELIDYVNSIAHRKVWLPADFERAVRAVSEIERADSLRDLEGDSETRRDAYAKQIAECDRMIFRLRRVRRRAWEGIGWPKKTSGPRPSRGR